MDYKLIDEELKRLYDVLTIGANQDLELAKWAMARITAIHEALLVRSYSYRDTPSEVNYIVNPDTEISTKEFTNYSDKTESDIKAKDVIVSTWTDSSGLTWYPALQGTYTFEQANKKAASLGLRLPTKEEFQLAEKEGIRTRFNDFKGRWFWSSSESASDFAWFFDGYYGKVGSDSRGYDDGSVRCVSRGAGR